MVNQGKECVVILQSQEEEGKLYRIATEKDLEAYREAELYLEKRRAKLMEEWGIDPVLDEPLPPKETLGFRVQRYGMLKWGDLFNSRQKLALITFVEKVRIAYRKTLEEGYEEDFAKAIVSYLALAVDKIATYLCNLTRWRGDALSFERAFDRQALPMVWDYGEINPFSDSRGCWEVEGMIEVLTRLTSISK